MRSDNKPLLIGLIVVQAAISASLWVLNAISVDSTAAFALLLGADVLIFAGVCHFAFFTEEDEAERAMPIAPISAYATDDEAGLQRAKEGPHPTQPLVQMPTVLSRNLRLAVPASSIAMLVLLSVLVGSGQGTTADLFIPIYIFMVVVYVLASIYFFKALMERDKETALKVEGQVSQSGHQVHHVHH
jgi:hypothetical protein